VARLRKPCFWILFDIERLADILLLESWLSERCVEGSQRIMVQAAALAALAVLSVFDTCRETNEEGATSFSTQ